jgi:glycosyltransferase involved in cell wall biosynthesis
MQLSFDYNLPMGIPQPHATVAMMTFNHENYIASTVKSILAQTYEDFELVIVDDGSSDNTAHAIRGFTDPRIRYIWQKNQGPSEAPQYGFQGSPRQVARTNIWS